MIVDLNQIENRIDAGLIRRQWTSDRKLQILNYTTKCSIERAWDEYTTLTRGLILTADGRIHARSFKKFWNIGEAPGPSREELPAEIPEITRKLDGYLGIMYWHNGKVRIASRGSFESEYALWATDWLRNNMPQVVLNAFDDEDNFFPVKDTLNFEILHPKRIVVDNRRNLGLTLLAAIDTETGRDVGRLYCEQWRELTGLPVVDWFVIPEAEREGVAGIGKLLDAAQRIKGTEEEGWILYYPQADLRVKIKGDDYCKIHRIATKLTRRRIWELMSRFDQKSGYHAPESLTAACTRVQEIRVAMPQEYGTWIAKTATDIWFKYSGIAGAFQNDAATFKRKFDESRKDFVARLQKEFPGTWHLVLAIIDGKEQKVREYAWWSIYPAHEPALLQDGEDE